MYQLVKQNQLSVITPNLIYNHNIHSSFSADLAYKLPILLYGPSKGPPGPIKTPLLIWLPCPIYVNKIRINTFYILSNRYSLPLDVGGRPIIPVGPPGPTKIPLPVSGLSKGPPGPINTPLEAECIGLLGAGPDFP